MLEFQNYGQERNLDATPEETEIFEIIKRITEADDLQFVRKSDNYVTAAVGPYDVARFKFISRAKWIMFPPIEIGSTKHRIKSTKEVDGFQNELMKSLEHARKNAYRQITKMRKP